jgi:hypothetical protein
MSNSEEKTQICVACGQRKVLSLFLKWRLKCKACKSAENSARLKERYKNDPKFVKATKQRAADWQRKNAERSNEYHRRRHAAKVADGRDKAWRKARYARPENRASMLVSGARNRALKAGIEFTLTFDDVYPTVAKGTCQVTGIAFDLSTHPKHRTHPFAPSIDRIDSSKGYTTENIRIVCWWLNCACGVWGLETILPGMRAIVDANHLPDV